MTDKRTTLIFIIVIICITIGGLMTGNAVAACNGNTACLNAHNIK